MPSQDFYDRARIIYEVCDDDLITPYDQSRQLGEHDQSGLCLGLSFNWCVHRLGNSAFPVHRLDMARVRFDQAFGNLQSKARKGHLPTGRAFAEVTIPDGLFDRKPVVPDRSHQPDVRVYGGSHDPIEVDLGTARDEMGKLPGDYPDRVWVPALKQYRRKLHKQSKRHGFMSPRCPEGIECVGRKSGSFGMGSSSGWMSAENMRQLLRSKQADYSMRFNVTSRITTAFKSAFSQYKQHCRDLLALTGRVLAEPLTADVCAINGWLASRTGSGHAVALSYNEAQGWVRYFDPNIGDFAFWNWDEFETWHSAVFAGLYRGKQYAKWDLELYARPPV